MPGQNTGVDLVGILNGMVKIGLLEKIVQSRDLKEVRETVLQISRAYQEAGTVSIKVRASYLVSFRDSKRISVTGSE